MVRVKERYSRPRAEKRFAAVYEVVEGDRCLYCGMPSDGKQDHQPPVYVLHRFADGGLVTKRQIREHFGTCKLVPCCTICNMGLGAYHGVDDNDRRREIATWFLVDERYPEDRDVLALGETLVEDRLRGTRGTEIYEFPGSGRVIYLNALLGFMGGEYSKPEDFPDWLTLLQSELAEWLRGALRRKAKYFLEMASLESYDLLPHARDDPRGQYG